MGADFMVKSVVCTIGAVTLIFSGALMAADGKSVYESACKLCHGTGMAGAPKLGDKAAWASRIAKGQSVLEDHAIHGFKDKGIMPAKGGKASLSDDDVKAAVAYMTGAVK